MGIIVIAKPAAKESILFGSSLCSQKWEWLVVDKGEGEEKG